MPSGGALSFDNTGPWSLLGKMKVEWHHGSVSVGLLITLLTFTTLSLQFTSTILLSQVGLGSLPVAIWVPQTYNGIKTDGSTFKHWFNYGNPSFLDSTPVRFPAFAEWTPNKTILDTTSHHRGFAPNNTPGMRDSGTVMRAFLPVSSDEERSRLTEYHGYATVIDTRVVCMRPKLTNVSFSGDEGYHVTGLADIEKEPLGLIQRKVKEGGGNFSLPFDCNFATAATENGSIYDWPLALCHASYDTSEQGIYSVMEPKGKKELGDSWLLVNATALEALTDLEGSDVWESVTIFDLISPMHLQFTLCMTAFQAQRMQVNATRPVPIPPEPVLLWNTSRAMWDTKDVLRQLGAGTSSVSPAERGIFNLAPRPWQWPKYPEIVSLTGDAFETTSAHEWVGWDPLYPGMINDALYQIFSQMASSAKDPALALQAFLTTLCSMCYYDRITTFDSVAPSLQVSMVQVTRPLGWTAFIIVASLAMLHLLLILLAILIFQRAGSLSRIQNSWASISQLLGPTTEDWIRDAGMVDDKTVKSWLKDRGLDKRLVGITDVQSRVQLIEKETAS